MRELSRIAACRRSRSEDLSAGGSKASSIRFSRSAYSVFIACPMSSNGPYRLMICSGWVNCRKKSISSLTGVYLESKAPKVSDSAAISPAASNSLSRLQDNRKPLLRFHLHAGCVPQYDIRDLRTLAAHRQFRFIFFRFDIL